MNSTIQKRRCVYTTMIGDYENLNDQAVSRHSSIEFICLTDNETLQSETWQFRHVSPLFKMDPIRSQRDLKIRPHIHLPEYDETLYIDNTVILTEIPEKLFDIYLSDRLFSLPIHSLRQTVLDEFLEVSRLGYDDQSRIFEQLNHYLLDHADVLNEQPFWTAILLRDNRDARIRAMQEFWLAHVNRYSRRDQLSVNLAFRAAGVTPNPIPIDNLSSWFHSWPTAKGRDRSKGPRTNSVSFQPQPARLRALELALLEHRKAAREAAHSHEEALEAQRRHYEHELEVQSRRQMENSEHTLTEQKANFNRSLLEAAALHEAALNEERARHSALLASPAGKITGRLSRIAHRFPRLARLAWRGTLVLWWTLTFQLFARLRERRR